MEDHDRILDNRDRIEALEGKLEQAVGDLDQAITDAGTPQDEPHHEMAQDVAVETVKAGQYQQIVLLMQVKQIITNAKWFFGLSLLAAVVVLAVTRG